MELGQLTQNAMTVLKKRYLQKDPQGNIVETPEELFRRVAKNIAQVDQNHEHTDSQGTDTRYYLDSAPGGVALGAAGLAAVGVGVWYWTRGTHVRASPTVSAVRTGASVGWSGSF